MTREGNPLPPKGVRPDPPPPPKNWRKAMKECPLLNDKELPRALAEVSVYKEALKISDSTIESQQKRITKLVETLNCLMGAATDVAHSTLWELSPTLEAAVDLLNVEDRERENPPCSE